MSYRCLSEPTYQYLCVIVDLIALYTPFRPADDQYQDNSAQIQNHPKLMLILHHSRPIYYYHYQPAKAFVTCANFKTNLLVFHTDAVLDIFLLIV